jgi:hypothetical protein
MVSIETDSKLAASEITTDFGFMITFAYAMVIFYNNIPVGVLKIK